MNSFVKNPSIWATAIARLTSLINISDVDVSLRHLYWFNLWFAAERDMNDIRKNIVEALVTKVQTSKWLDQVRDCNTIESLRINMTTEIEILLSDTNILERAEKFSDYKKSVEERAESSDFRETSASL